MESGSRKSLIVKLIIFPIPLILLSLVVLIPFRLSGELIDIDDLITEQHGKRAPLLLGLAYSNPTTYFKRGTIRAEKPQVIALGSSRVMQFREFFFKDKTLFYNAGGAVNALYQFIPFLEKVVKESPQTTLVVAGLDQFLFHPQYAVVKNSDRQVYDSSLSQCLSQLSIVKNSYKPFILDYLAKKFSVRELVRNSNNQLSFYYGLNAVMNGDGFRNDGSYRYGKVMSFPERSDDYQFKNTLSRIERGNRRFEYSGEVCAAALGELDRILAFCRKHNLHMVGFLPPFAPTVFEALKSKGSKYDYLWKLNDALTPVFDKYSYPLFDFGDMSPYGGLDDEFIDGFHGSEKIYARLFVMLSERDEVLSRYANATRLREFIKKPVDNFSLVDDGLHRQAAPIGNTP